MENKIWKKYIEYSCKPYERFTVGVEIELIGFDAETKTRLSYPRIKRVLNHFVDKFGWRAVTNDSGDIIGAELNRQNITLEPGGQFELSGGNHPLIKEIEQEIGDYREKLLDISLQENIIWLSCGYDPITKIKDVPRMPKKRYDIMERILPQTGESILGMMFCTAGCQASFDYSSVEDAIKKLRVGNYYGAFLGVLLANSPLIEGELNDLTGNRMNCWALSDPRRAGMPAGLDKQSFGMDDYVKYILSAPLFARPKENDLEELPLISWHDYVKTAPAERLEGDFLYHASTVFPFCRIKSIAETRTTDMTDIETVLAVTAFWKGLFYDEETLASANQACLDKYSRISADDLRSIGSAKLNTSWSGFVIADEIKSMISQAKKGLSKTAEEEIKYLEPMERLLQGGKTKAELIASASGGVWEKLAAGNAIFS